MNNPKEKTNNGESARVHRLVRCRYFRQPYRSEGESRHDLVRDEKCVEIPWLNLVSYPYRFCRQVEMDQSTPIHCFVVPQYIYASPVDDLLGKLEEILMDIFPDSFLFQEDLSLVRRGTWYPPPIYHKELEDLSVQIQDSYHQILSEMEKHPDRSIGAFLRWPPYPKTYKPEETVDDDVLVCPVLLAFDGIPHGWNWKWGQPPTTEATNDQDHQPAKGEKL